MRTTLINTTFWREDDIDSLHLDSKLLYLFMLTNPDKGLANIYHYKPKVFSAYSGLSVEQIEIATKQLVSLGYIDVYNGYYVLLKGHEKPKTGRFTEKTIERELEMVPTDVVDHFNLLVSYQSSSGVPLVDSSGVAPEHKDNNKDKDNTNNKSIVKSNSKTIDELFIKWHEIVGYDITSKLQTNRTAVSKLLKSKTDDELERMLKGVALSQEDRYAPRISNFIDLEKKWDELVAWGKRSSVSKNMDVAVI